MLTLSHEKPFAQGGNRLCFVHPEDPNLCVKVRRPDFTLQDLRRKKGFPRNLRPLSSFDDNLEEFRVINHLVKSRGEDIYKHIYRCDGFVETDLGRGLITELVRDEDGCISLSLKEYLWHFGYNQNCLVAVEQLTSFWRAYSVPSRDLLTHNILVQQGGDDQIIRLVVIDGLGSPHILPFDLLPNCYRRRYIEKKIYRLHGRIKEFIHNCQAGKSPSRIGMLLRRE